MVTTEQLMDIFTEASLRLHRNIKTAYKEERLENYLMSLGMEDLMPQKDSEFFDTNPDGKIIIFGDSQVKEKNLLGCCKELGLSADRVDLQLGYKEAVNYQFSKLQYSYDYRLILFGPIPHSTKDKSEYSSIINKLENTEGYAKVIRLTDSNGLKISKSIVKDALKKEIDARYLAV